MTARSATYFPRSKNAYVPSMSYSADVQIGQPYVADFGAPATASTTGIFSALTIGSTAKVFTSANWAAAFLALTTQVGMLDAPYGRNIQATGNASTDQVVTITGRDYLGQPMKENITLAGAATIAGKKAFKWVDRVDVTVGTGGTTLSLGWGDVLGLPYRAIGAVTSIEDEIAATAGTFVAGAASTTTQTATTADPRGTIDFNSASNGTKKFKFAYLVDEANMHGNRQFFA